LEKGWIPSVVIERHGSQHFEQSSNSWVLSCEYFGTKMRLLRPANCVLSPLLSFQYSRQI
jgi:hypothetical protein